MDQGKMRGPHCWAFPKAARGRCGVGAAYVTAIGQLGDAARKQNLVTHQDDIGAIDRDISVKASADQGSSRTLLDTITTAWIVP